MPPFGENFLGHWDNALGLDLSVSDGHGWREVPVLVPGAGASACARTRLAGGGSGGGSGCGSGSGSAGRGSARSRLAGGGFGLAGGLASTAFYPRVGELVFRAGTKASDPEFYQEDFEVSFHEYLKPNSHMQHQRVSKMRVVKYPSITQPLLFYQ